MTSSRLTSKKGKFCTSFRVNVEDGIKLAGEGKSKRMVSPGNWLASEGGESCPERD